MRSFLKWLLICAVWVTSMAEVNTRGLTFGMVTGTSSFFEPVQLGWEEKCRELGVTCFYRVPNKTEECNAQDGDIVQEFLAMGVNGIAVHPCDKVGMVEHIRQAEAAGVPVVTFDSDVPESQRVAYIGTNQEFLGRTMARLLRQLRPEGGTFSILGLKEGRVEGFRDEITRYNDRKGWGHWHEIFSDDPPYPSVFLRLQNLAEKGVTAVVTMKQTPMKDANWTHHVDMNRHKKITYIGVDGSEFQLDFLHRRYVDGLIGQLPYEFGSVSAQVLFDNITKGSVSASYFPTNLVSYNLIPVELPPLEVDQNLLGNLKYLGYICYGLVAVSVVVAIGWTLYHRACVVVRAAQPFFLVMVALGVLVLSSSLITLSFDDNGDPDSLSQSRSVGMCMATPWLAFVGFTVTFSALFSKTRRVNQIFRAKVSHARIQVTEKDVLGPFAVLLTSNIVVLLCWTIIDPLTYVRQEHDGTDYWNRVISSHGACQSDHTLAFLIPLAVINASVVFIACWQAMQARGIESEFSEAKYIGFAVASMFQAFLTGIPVVFVVHDSPRAYYVVLSMMIFMLSLVILLLVFLPKMFMQRVYSGKSEEEQKRMLQAIIRRRSSGSGHRSSTRSSGGRFSGVRAPFGLSSAFSSAGGSGAIGGVGGYEIQCVGGSNEAAVSHLGNDAGLQSHQEGSSKPLDGGSGAAGASPKKPLDGDSGATEAIPPDSAKERLRHMGASPPGSAELTETMANANSIGGNQFFDEPQSKPSFAGTEPSVEETVLLVDEPQMQLPDKSVTAEDTVSEAPTEHPVKS